MWRKTISPGPLPCTGISAPSQPEHVKHGGVTHLLEFRRIAASVRHALEQIAAKREAEGKKRAAPPAKSTKSAAASPDLTELLRNVGPDELRDALRAADWEPAALRELRDYIDEMLDKSLQHASQREAHT
jgi:hypothetical protein